MGLFKILRQKQVSIKPETQVTIEYIKAEKLSDIFDSLRGDLLFIKRSISRDDANWLKSYSGNCIVFTTHPDTIETFDVQSELKKIITVNHLKSIGLNYIHCGDVLYAFAYSIGFDFKPEVPNMLRIHPVHRNDIETQISVVIGVLDAALGIKKSSNDKIDSHNKELSDQQNNVNSASENLSSEKQALAKIDLVRKELSDQQNDANNTSENLSSEKQVPAEIDLVRAELKNLFDARYTIVKVELKGTSIERKTISLSEFYNKHNIAKGRLKGSWILFEKEQLNEIIDEGIARKAMEDVYRRFTINIDGYGRIVRIENKDGFIAAMNKIEDDFRSYLRGNSKCEKVGEISIKTAFTPAGAINLSQSELMNYLISVCPVKGLETEKYIGDVKRFVDEVYWELTDFASNVELKYVKLTFTVDQWQDFCFLKSVWRTYTDNRKYFTDDIVGLLERYMKLMYKSQKN